MTQSLILQAAASAGLVLLVINLAIANFLQSRAFRRRLRTLEGLVASQENLLTARESQIEALHELTAALREKANVALDLAGLGETRIEGKAP